MSLTTSVKRAPRWAWYIGGGVGLGAVAIQVYRHRAQDETDGSSPGQVVGTPGGTSAPSPVITPPVIIQPPDTPQPDFTGLFAVFGDALNNAVGTIGGLAQGDQGITQTSVTTIGQLAGNAFDLARQAVANAGQAPSPIAQTPTPIIVTVPTPTTPAIVAPSLPSCPPSFPLWSNQNRQCYKECSHCEDCSSGSKGCKGGKRRNIGNCYQDGHRVNTDFTNC